LWYDAAAGAGGGHQDRCVQSMTAGDARRAPQPQPFYRAARRQPSRRALLTNSLAGGAEPSLSLFPESLNVLADGYSDY
jgi:hypothetical protein